MAELEASRDELKAKIAETQDKCNRSRQRLDKSGVDEDISAFKVKTMEMRKIVVIKKMLLVVTRNAIRAAKEKRGSLERDWVSGKFVSREELADLAEEVETRKLVCENASKQ